jgi:hypothetical protein
LDLSKFMKKCLNIILLIFYIPFAFGQEQFKGDFTFNKLAGYSEFQFKKGPDQTIVKDGKFNFSRIYIDSVMQNKVYKNFAEGAFKSGLKHGNWIYNNEEHEISIKDVRDFKVISELESFVFTLESRYDAGVPNGIWSFHTDRFIGNRIETKSSAERIAFKDGFITGNLQYKTIEGGKTFFINGRLSDVGEMDGEWRLVYEQDSILISENRKYEKGFLLGLVKRDLNSGDLIEEVIYFSTIEKLNEIKNKLNVGFEISERKFEVRYNDGFRKRFREYQAQLPGNAFIENFLRQILQFENADYIDDEGEFLKFPIYTRRFIYDLDEDDKIRISEIPATFQELKSKTNTYANMNSLALNKSKSDSLAFAHEFFQASLAKFQNFENLIDIIQTGRIEFYDLSNYIQSGLEYVSNADTINYTFNKEPRQKVITFRKVIENQENFLRDFSEYLEEELDMVTSLGEFIEQELFEIGQDDDIRQIESEILARRKYVDSLYVNHDFIHLEEADLFNQIRLNFLLESFDKYVEEYGNMDSYAEKVGQSEKIIDLLNEIEKQFDALTKIYPSKEKLDELYQEEFFNPFTFSRYNQRVKERLFENGGMRLFDHYIRQLKEEKDYTKIKDQILKFENLHGRMLQLRNEDTRKLERKMRNNISPSKLESLLSL